MTTSPTKTWVAVQVYVQMDVVFETNVLGMWSDWDEALAYVSRRHDFEEALVTSQVIDSSSLAWVPVWSWSRPNRTWETVTITPLDVSSSGR